jgi:60 kDa SS-A/Ro ribonucleoprotein
MSALRKYTTKPSLDTPVSRKVRDDQLANNGGGYSFTVSDKSRLERFLILGVDGGTFYVTENDLTKQNVDWLQELVRRDSALVLDTLLDVSTNGRAYRNGPAIFALALVLNYGDQDSKSRAVSIAPQVARTATMVFELAQFIENLGGWGRAKRRAVANWFLSKTPDELAYQAVKYRQRNGWTLRDLMRLSHPVGVDQRVGNFILGKGGVTAFGTGDVLTGFKMMQNSVNITQVLSVLEQFPSLPWETIPTQFLKDPEVWKQLFANGQLRGQALVRNITRLSRMGAFDDMVFAREYADALKNPEMIAKSRLHPMQYLNASIVYSEGQMDRESGYWASISRKKDWTVKPAIRDALKEGFYLSFKNVTPANKRFMLGVDVSGSMSWSAATGSDLTAAQGAAAMAMVTARVEPYTDVFGFANTFRDLGISPEDSFENILRKTKDQNFGSTNIALPMDHALKNKILVDTFVVITDNEVNTGSHPHNALKRYRQQMNPEARLVVMGMTATNVTVADPLDRGMLDVVGFDSNAPKVVSDFAAGRL